MPILGDPGQENIARSLRTTAAKVLRNNDNPPLAIVLVTAHWEEDIPTITTSAKPKLLYDYYGFPPEAYKLTYDAPGSPDVAKRVAAVLKKAGIASRDDGQRGKVAYAIQLFQHYAQGPNGPTSRSTLYIAISLILLT
jgi:4,5-DOPA dioxygenase extradiol